MLSQRVSAVLVILCSGGCIRSVADVPTTEGGFITGTVITKSSDTGTFDPIGGARIELVGTSFRVTSDEEGFFRLRRLPIGRNYVLQIDRRPTGGRPALGRRIDGIRIEVDGQSVDLGTVRLGGLGDIEGEVRIEGLDFAGAAEGTHIVLASSPFSAIVGRSGSYRMVGVPPGPFELAAYRAGYQPARIDEVGVTSGLRALVRSVVLHPEDADARYELSGSVEVLDAEDDGVEVSLIEETTTSSAPREFGPTTTDARGSYAVRVPAGVYRGRFTKDGYRPVELRNVLIGPNGTIGLVPVMLVASETGDTDGDGVPDADDLDDDDDGCPDEDDDLPLNPLGCRDRDGDGEPDEVLWDIDGDSLSNAEETSLGRDGFITDPLDVDTDDDGEDDAVDNCPIAGPAMQPDGDGDGIGDLCGVPSPNGPVQDGPVVVTGFAPASGAVGTEIAINGTGFVPSAAFVEVSFAGGVAVPHLASTTRLLVRVPAEAATGPLSVRSGSRIGTSSASFTFLAPPRVESFSPVSVHPGETAAAFGRDFGATPTVRVGAIAAAVVPCGAAHLTAAMGRDVVCFQPAPGSIAAPVVVTGPNGEGRSAASLTILGGPEFAAFTVNPVPVGATTTILGRGFETETPNAVTVELTGATPVTPSSVTATEVVFTIPQGAQSGPAIVDHPAGRLTTPVLVIDDGQPTVGALTPAVVIPGETLTISGAYLDTVTNVTFTGGGSAVPSAIVGTTTLDVTVPMGVQAGPVTLSSSIHPDRTSSARLGVLRITRGTNFPPGGFEAGLALDSTGALVARHSGGTIRIDPTNLQPLTVGPVDGFGSNYILIGSGPRGLLASFEAFIVGLPDIDDAVACPDWGNLPDFASAVIIHGGSRIVTPRNVGGTTGIWVADMASRTCGVVGQRTDVRINAIQELPSGELLLRGDAGFAVYDVTTGTYAPDFGGGLNPTPLFSTARSASWIGAPNTIYSSNGEVTSLTGTGSRTVPIPSLSAPVSQSADTRWLVTGNGRLFDLTTHRIVRTDLPSASFHGHRPLPNGASFVTTSGNEVIRIDIDD